MIMDIKNQALKYSIEAVCLAHGVSRQAYYKHNRSICTELYQEDIVLQLVYQVRRKQPMIGGRKLLYLLKDDFTKLNFSLGRDKFFNILRNNDLLIKPNKQYKRTTNSNHRFRVHSNLIKELKIDRINQVFVSDITYLSTWSGFVYLALVTDVFSRKILGYDVSESLSIEGSLRALKKALLSVKSANGLIHHSDRGIQYCSHEYTGLLESKNIAISMGEKGNPYENAIAERINGILKLEFLLNQTFRTKADAKRAVEEAIKTYNEERPHMSLGNLTPEQMYRQGRAA